MQVEFLKKYISETHFKNFYSAEICHPSTQKAGEHQASCNLPTDSSPIPALLQDSCCAIVPYLLLFY